MTRLLCPEVIQTSNMDCGPAALKAVLEGFGVPISYGRLREACQTDVDGTSIDMLEELAVELGMEAEQTMLPVDHVLVDEAAALPALAVVRLPNGVLHFVVAWRRHSGVVQVMDPATGRRWPSHRRFLAELFENRMRVPAEAWRDMAGDVEFQGALARRIAALGVPAAAAAELGQAALADPGWQPVAALDAATRLTATLVSSGALERGAAAEALVRALARKAAEQPADAEQPVPSALWTVRPAPPDAEGQPQLLMRGAVLVRMRGRRDAPPPREALAAALAEPPSRPGRELLGLMRPDGLFSPALVACALLLASIGVGCETVILRGLFELGRELTLARQRLTGVGILVGFMVVMLVLELGAATALVRVGRRLEARLRMAFLAKIPRLGDRYFSSRLSSDMAERSHAVHQLRDLPMLAGDLLRAGFDLLLTMVGVIWLAPHAAPAALTIVALAIALPLLVLPVVRERDLRVRSHGGALARFYLDALLGLVAVRAHCAERSLRREHEGLLGDWWRAGLARERANVAIEAVLALSGFGLAAWLLASYLVHGGEAGGVVLLVYWGLTLPQLAERLSKLARQIPLHRNVTLRLLEPLGAPDDVAPGAEAPPAPASQAAAIRFSGVGIAAAGHAILTGIDLVIAPGEHVAIVGPSGAGKSSLVGTLLGWYRPAAGELRVDGARLGGPELEALRRRTAWVDPAVQLWNRSLLDNLHYGARDGALPIGTAVERAGLGPLLEKLPEGLQMRLGEGGALVSGGEGQRVRLGRALSRPGVRLALLDEPFRGLDREQRRELLARAREHWQAVTLLCVTHDVGETQAFPRVLVIEEGHLVEDGAPAELAARPGSRYRAMLDAEAELRRGLWSDEAWRRLRMSGGRIDEGDASPPRAAKPHEPPQGAP